MTNRAAIDSTGRVIRGGWHHGVGVCRPGQKLDDLKNKRAQAFDAERAERRAQIEHTISTLRSQLAGELPAQMKPIMEQMLVAAERDLASFS